MVQCWTHLQFYLALSPCGGAGQQHGSPENSVLSPLYTALCLKINKYLHLGGDKNNPRLREVPLPLVTSLWAASQ